MLLCWQNMIFKKLSPEQVCSSNAKPATHGLNNRSQADKRLRNMLLLTNIFFVCSTLFGVKVASTILSSDYGFWDIQVIIGNSASGFRWGDLYAEHSRNPGIISHSYWIQDQEHQTIEFRPDDRTLRNTMIFSLGVLGRYLLVWELI